MDMETRQKDTVLVIKPLDERLDAKAASEFKEKTSQFITNGARLIVFDFSEVNFIDSSGLGAIVSCLKMIGRQGNIAIANAAKAVADMFRLTRMDRVFPMADSTEAAIKRLSGQDSEN